jgi:hypothetical protein
MAMRTRTRKQTLARALDSMFRTVVIGLAIYGGLDLLHGVMAQDQEALYLPSVAQAAQVQSLEERVATLEDLLVHVSREGNDIYVTGANLHVVNGTGATDGITNGLGNVIIGYNETRVGSQEVNDRSGSHMLVVGKWNNYSSFGGIVVGVWNSTSGSFASVSGGGGNRASGWCASVSGGDQNVASGSCSSVSGGSNSNASGDYASISGGWMNESIGDYSSVSGGGRNVASGEGASVSGGRSNVARGTGAAVSGGFSNESSGYFSSVNGGHSNVASGEGASVSGGRNRQATRDYNWRAGDLFQEN